MQVVFCGEIGFRQGRSGSDHFDTSIRVTGFAIHSLIVYIIRVTDIHIHDFRFLMYFNPMRWCGKAFSVGSRHRERGVVRSCGVAGPFPARRTRQNELSPILSRRTVDAYMRLYQRLLYYSSIAKRYFCHFFCQVEYNAGMPKLCYKSKRPVKAIFVFYPNQNAKLEQIRTNDHKRLS